MCGWSSTTIERHGGVGCNPRIPRPRLALALIVGGRSNLTSAVTDGVAHGVLRRPPLGHVLATADDMGREYRVLTALAPTVVPVPRTVLLWAMGEGLQAEFVRSPIVVSTILPGYIRTELNEKVRNTPMIVGIDKGSRALVRAVERDHAGPACRPGRGGR
jgi:aminoglycoside phosphotransferase (APT) family kinase protein